MGTSENDKNSPSKEWLSAFCEKNIEISSIKYSLCKRMHSRIDTFLKFQEEKGKKSKNT